MGYLTAGESNEKVIKYCDEIQRMIDSLDENFDSMKFENADKKDAIYEIKNNIIEDCKEVQFNLKNLTFE